MARSTKTIVTITDDLTGEEIPEAEAHEIRLAYQGKTYLLDLGPTSVKELESALDPFLASARQEKSTPKKPKTGPDAAKVRAWAAENGHTVGKNGRIPGPILEAYNAAH